MARLALILILLVLLAVAVASILKWATRLAEARTASPDLPTRKTDPMPKGLRKITYPLLLIVLFQAVTGVL